MSQEYQMSENNSLGPITVNSFGEKVFFNLNRNSFDKVSAQALFDTRFAKSLFNEDALNIIVGTDSGLLPHYIQSKHLPNGTRYIFVEPEAVLLALNNQQMLLDLDEERIACISMDDWEETIQNFKIKDYFYINAVQSFNAICAEDDHIQEYAEISWYITEVLSQLHWLNTIELGSESFISRQIHNLADNVRPAKMLENTFSDKTVVLLAGGPSLDIALPWVREHRKNVVVFAVSRISRQLLEAEIAPDFVFSVDPTELSFDVSKEMLNFGEKTTFICSHHTVPTLVNQWPGVKLYLGERLPWKSTLNLSNLSAAGPTVTNTALNVAYDFGFKTIILAGVDLCFTREGYTHAKGSDEHLAGPRFNLTSLQVETNAGTLAPTSCDFAQAIKSLSLQADLLVSRGCRIVNVSGNAARIDNIEYLPLDQLNLQPDSFEASTIIQNRFAIAETDSHYYKNCLTELKRAQFQIKAIAKLAENARSINDAMYSQEGFIENYKDKRQLDQIEKKFKRDYRQFSKLVKKFGIRRFIKLTKPFSDQEWTAEEAKQLGNVFYDAYQEGAGKLLRLVDDAIERVSARQQEVSVSPDLEILLAQCRKDRSFGRVRLWRRKGLDKSVSVNVANAFNEFEQQFLEIINDKNTRHFANAKDRSSLGMVKHRAGLLFKHKKIEELQDLQVGLSKHHDQVAAEPYRHLIAGYIAELEKQPEAALDAFQLIVDGGEALLEEALIRIASIGIDYQDINTANLSLQCLSQLNPQYLPLFAEMQRLHGDVMQAIDSYNRYIESFPEDTLTQIKLAMLYAEQGVYDAAGLMLDYILEKKPNLESALAIKNQLLALRPVAEYMPE